MSKYSESQYRQMADITRMIICILLSLLMLKQIMIHDDVRLLLQLYQTQNKSCNGYKCHNETNNE